MCNTMFVSPEVQVMLQPTDAYRRLARECPPVTAVGALRRPALVALVIGCAISIAGTGRATAPLVISTALTWSWTVLWQLIAAAAIVRAKSAPLTLPQRIDLLFAGHAPWSLWLLATAAWSKLFPQFSDLYALLSTVVVPAVWTAAIVHGFCCGALGLPQSAALRRTAIHQALIWGVAFFYVAWAIALWPRLAPPA
jgi:hypothetical protein